MTDETTSEFHHGEMPIADHARTYLHFNSLTKWFCLHLAAIVLVFTLWFCVGAGFFAGLIPGIVLLAIGIFALRSKPPSIHR